MLLEFSEIMLKSTIFKHLGKIRIFNKLYKRSKKRETKALFYVMKSNKYKCITAFLAF